MWIASSSVVDRDPEGGYTRTRLQSAATLKNRNKTLSLTILLLLVSLIPMHICMDQAQYEINWEDFNLVANQSQTLNLEKFTNVRYAHEFNGLMQYNFTMTLSSYANASDFSFINVFNFMNSTDKAQYLKYKAGLLNLEQVRELKQLLCVTYLKNQQRIQVVNGTISLNEEIPISKFSNASAVNVLDSSDLCLEKPLGVETVKYSIAATVGLKNLDNEYVTVFYGRSLILIQSSWAQFFPSSC